MVSKTIILISISLILTLVCAKNNPISVEEASLLYSSHPDGYDYDNNVFYDGETMSDLVKKQLENRDYERYREEQDEYEQLRSGRQATAPPRPVIKIGYSYYFQGDPTPRQGVETWAYQVNTTTGLNISGIIYNVRLVIYNDGNDCNSKYILYKYMAEVDNVTAFIAPAGTCFGSKTFYGIATQYKIPMVNGANSVLAWFTPISLIPYVWTLFPPINGVTGDCTAAMKIGCGLETAVYLFLNGTQATSLYSLQITNLQEYSINATEIAINSAQVGSIGSQLWNDTMDAIIISLRDDIKPDMFFWSYYGGVTMLDRIRRAKFEPPAIFTQAGVGLLPARLAAGWRGRGLLALSAWDETTVFPDPYFGNSTAFVNLYKKLFNGTIDTFSGVMGAAAVVLGRGLEIAGTLTDGVAISNAIKGINETIFFGPMFFNATSHLIGQNDPCWQVNDTDFFNPVWPPSYPNTVPLICPYKPTYPPPPPINHHWARFYGIRIGIPFSIVIFGVLIVLVVMYARNRWYLVVIAKNDVNRADDEWGNQTMSSIGNSPIGHLINKMCCFVVDE